jgi:uncharacterized membrane protein
MVWLLAACAFFLGIHVVISGSPLRGVIVSRIGERAYLGLFSLLSLIGMVWLARAYMRADGRWLWSPPLALRWMAPLLILVALLFVVVGLTTPSPTAAGGEGRLDVQEPARGVLRITRHPFLWGVALWAITHMAVNGDSASLALFGTLLGLALVGPLLIDAKRRRAFGPKWERFAAVTSNVPFAAVVAGRNAMRLGEIGTWRIALAVAVWAALLMVHPWLFGVSALPP